MVAIHDKRKPLQVNPKKDGTYYDDCPSCGTRDIDRRFKAGGRDGRGEEHLQWSIYSCDPRAGGCGVSWTRDTKQGQETAHRQGREPKWVTASAAAERATSLPSKAYQRGYEKIDWSK